jgi:hypothetical protein
LAKAEYRADVKGYKKGIFFVVPFFVQKNVKGGEKMSTANPEIREYLRIKQIPLWEVGAFLNVCENTIIRWMRTEMNDERRALVDKAVAEIIGQRNSK